MITFTTRWQPILASLTLALGSVARAGWAADDAPPAKAPETPSAQERPLLSGPEVEDEAVRPMRRGRDGEMAAQRRQAQEIIPARLWIRALQALDLDETQHEAVQERIDAHRDAMIAFAEEHGEAMRDLRISMREQRGNPEALAELRARMQKIEDNLPRIEMLQRDLWRLLRENQQQALRERLAEIREEIIKRREAELERQRSAQGEGETDARPQPRRRSPPGSGTRGEDVPPTRRAPAGREAPRPRGPE